MTPINRPRELGRGRHVKHGLRVGSTEWRLTGTRYLGTTLKSRRPAIADRVADGTKFISISWLVTNRMPKPVRGTSSVKIKDSSGREYKPIKDSESYLTTDRELTVHALRPNKSREFSAIFEVPSGAYGFRLVARELGRLLGGEKGELPLGI